MYRMLNRKLVRELWRSRAQIAAIAFIIIGGVGTWVISFSTIDSLELMQSAYYREYRFADAFANVVRAPDAVSAKLREIPGVRAFATRVKTLASASVEGFGDPVTVEIVSIPDHAPPDINALYLRHGRLPEHLSSHEMVISEPFANAHALQRHAARDDQRPASRDDDHGHRSVTRICLPDTAGRAVSRSHAFRDRLDAARAARNGDGHGRRHQ